MRTKGLEEIKQKTWLAFLDLKTDLDKTQKEPLLNWRCVTWSGWIWLVFGEVRGLAEVDLFKSRMDQQQLGETKWDEAERKRERPRWSHSDSKSP